MREHTSNGQYGPLPESASEVVTGLTQQTKDLCEIHDHVTRVIGSLTFPDGAFTDQSTRDTSNKFSFEGMLRLYLYENVCEFSQSEVQRRMESWQYIGQRFGLRRAPRQQSISYFERRRLSGSDRATLSKLAKLIREICVESGVLRLERPIPDIDEINPAVGVESEAIQNAVRTATKLGFSEFSANRASNCKYPLEAFFERQAFLNMATIGTTSPRRLFEVESDRSEVPHGSTHNRTMKKVASPDPQLNFSDYSDGIQKPNWKRIRDKVLSAFHTGVENQLGEMAERDRQGIRTPVMAALDITTVPFWPSPYQDGGDVESGENPVEIETSSGRKREKYLKEDYPEMVSGYKDSSKKKAQRAYKFATLTIVAESTPIVLAIEPVRDRRGWEKGDEIVDRERTSRTDIVAGLLEQAEQHVEIHKLFCDREFDSHAVRDIIDQRDIQYVIGKINRSAEDAYNVKEITDDPLYDIRIEHAELWVEGRVHKVSIVYLPTGTDYSLFTLNGWVDNHRAIALTEQYRERWTIENQYKSIKKHFLPTMATKDYRIRFLYFVIGVILHNVWRLANFVLRDEVGEDVDLGESPPIPALEIVLRVGRYLLDPGD